MENLEPHTALSRKAPPRPKGTLLLGNLMDFQQNPLQFLSQAVGEHGDFIQLRFAHINAYFINHPDYIEEVLLKSAEHFDKNSRSAGKIRSTCGNSLLSGDAAAWARHRALVQPVFQPHFIAATGPAIDRQLSMMIGHWEQLARAKVPVDLVAEMMTMVMNITAQVLFGDQIDTVQLQRDLSALITDTWRRIGTFIDPSDASPLLHRTAFKQALESVDATAFSIIEKRRALNLNGSAANRDDLLGRLLKAHEETSVAGLDDQELRDAAVTLLLSGHETTASVITWALFHMAADQAALNSAELSAHDPALIFKEAVRLYPSIWIVERRALQKMRIGPYVIPKGAMVLISPFILHRHKEFWPDAERFDPARFAPEQADLRPRNAYLPFGLGKHRCVGVHLANLIGQRAIAAIDKHFEIVLSNASKPVPVPSVTLGHKGPIWATLVPRSPDI